MGLRFTITTRTERRIPSATARRPLAVFGGALLVAGVIALLWAQIDFTRYALGGFAWTRAEGRVVTATSIPRIEFATSDEASHSFVEDYILLCGRRSLCVIRHFAPGAVVPVVYDPAAPKRAFVDDWALRSGVIMWFVEAACGLLLALMLAIAVADKPLNLSFHLGDPEGAERPAYRDLSRHRSLERNPRAPS